ncbi:MAG: fumarylacetoacetate hydrolase family protein [Candidatus Aquicultorales bacterium]
MRFARVRIGSEKSHAIIEGEAVRLIDGTPFGSYAPSSQVLPLEDVVLCAPVEPSKVVAVGLNYRDHAAELGMAVPDEPILFIKPSSSVIGPGRAIVYPAMSGQVDFEAELAVVVKERTKAVTPDEALSHVLGYTCANDVTARDLQQKDGQWSRAKAFDTFCPLGPWIETDLDPSDLTVRSVLNGETKQSSSTSNFIFTVPALVSFISNVMTLEEGDVILTGTPVGVGPMRPGDTIEIEVEGIGRLVNRVV